MASDHMKEESCRNKKEKGWIDLRVTSYLVTSTYLYLEKYLVNFSFIQPEDTVSILIQVLPLPCSVNLF